MRGYRFFAALLFLLIAVFNWKWAFVLFVLMEVLQIFVGRVFCGYACVYGIYQSFLASIGRWLCPNRFGTLIPPRIHEALSCLRYVRMAALLFFAATSVGAAFSSVYAPDIRIWMDPSLYERPAFLWFAGFSLAGLLVERPYCKYFCSGSCFAGAFSRLRLFKLRRNEALCVQCKRCEKVCPMSVPITQMDVVESHNCIACYRCLDKGVCPKKGALHLDVHGVKKFWGGKKKRT